jgi:hypothetical protein
MVDSAITKVKRSFKKDSFKFLVRWFDYSDAELTKLHVLFAVLKAADSETLVGAKGTILNFQSNHYQTIREVTGLARNKVQSLVKGLINAKLAFVEKEHLRLVSWDKALKLFPGTHHSRTTFIHVPSFLSYQEAQAVIDGTFLKRKQHSCYYASLSQIKGSEIIQTRIAETYRKLLVNGKDYSRKNRKKLKDSIATSLKEVKPSKKHKSLLRKQTQADLAKRTLEANTRMKISFQGFQKLWGCSKTNAFRKIKELEKYGLIEVFRTAPEKLEVSEYESIEGIYYWYKGSCYRPFCNLYHSLQ